MHLRPSLAPGTAARFATLSGISCCPFPLRHSIDAIFKLSCKRRFYQPFDARLDAEQVASPRLLFPLFVTKAPPGCRDKEFIQVLAAKCERDDMLHGETNLALDFASRGRSA